MTFPTPKPTVLEYKSLPNLILTSDNPIYDPHDAFYEHHERAFLQGVYARGDPIVLATTRIAKLAQTLSKAPDAATLAIHDISLIHNDRGLWVDAVLSTFTITPGKNKFGPEHLACNWNFSLKTAKRTLEATTQ